MKVKLLILPILFITLIACNTEPVTNNKAKSIDTGIEVDSWVSIPAGEFFYGMHYYDTLIEHDFEIMKTKVTNQQYIDYLQKALNQGKIKIVKNKIKGYYPGEVYDNYDHEKKITEGYKLHMPLDDPGNHINYKDNTFIVDKGFKNHPVVTVTWFGARAYADFYGYRLPTELEWVKASRGEDKRAYPWGNEINTRVANYSHQNKALRDVLGNEVIRTTPVGFYNGKTYGKLKTLDNKSPHGVYDMAGNVWEWMSDDYPDTHYRYMRGGSFSNYGYNLTVWARNSAGPDHYSFNTGFRCVR